jgi:hypothetical protein
MLLVRSLPRAAARRLFLADSLAGELSATDDSGEARADVEMDRESVIRWGTELDLRAERLLESASSASTDACI